MDYLEASYTRKRPNAKAGHRTPAAALAAHHPPTGRNPWARNQQNNDGSA